MKIQTLKLTATTLTLLALGFGGGLYFNYANNNSPANPAEPNTAGVNNNTDNASIDNSHQSTTVRKNQQGLAQQKKVEQSEALFTDENPAAEQSNVAQIEQDSAADIAAEEIDLATAAQDVDQLLTNVLFQSSTEYGVTDATRDQLTLLVGEDPIANERVLEAYLADPHSSSGEMLALVLSEFKDANIEAAALQLTNPANDARDRLAGIEMLQRMGIENKETLQVALQIVNEESDTQLVNAALDTLQHQAVATTQNLAIRETILPRLDDADPEVRRRSVIAYSDWVNNADAAAPIIQALEDPSVDVRVGAAFAMSKVNAKSIEMRDALVQKLNDDEENWEVREQAWHALETHDMDEVSYQAYADFEALRATYGESVK